MIAVKGLPKEWFFRETAEGVELKKPWEADVDANIPHDIRELCDPMYIVFRHPALQSGAKEVIEKRRVLGFRIDYNSEPGRQMWEDVERFIEESIPRNERVPVPVLCARDERASFETFTPRRNTRGSLELSPSPVPMIDLTEYKQVQVSDKNEKLADDFLIPSSDFVPERSSHKEDNLDVKTEPFKESKNELLKCESCDYTHISPRGIRMHSMKKHPKKEKVEV